MAYDNSSVHGDEICDYYYDLSNNFMNPPSPLGFFVYKIIGGMFDRIDEVINQFRIDLSILDCNVGKIEIVDAFPSEANQNNVYYVSNYSVTGNSYTKYEYINGAWVSSNVETKILNSLDIFWGKSYQLLRPSVSYIMDGVTYSRKLTDKEYKVYLYIRNHRLMTKEDLFNTFNNAFGDGVEITKISLNDSSVVNHYEYDNPLFSNDTLERYSSSDMNVVTDYILDADVHVVNDYITNGIIINVNVPNNNWDTNFLTFLEQYSSIKGNVLITQRG